MTNCTELKCRACPPSEVSLCRSGTARLGVSEVCFSVRTPDRIERSEDGVIVVFEDGDRLPLPGICRVEIDGHAHEALTYAVIPHTGCEAEAWTSAKTLATLFWPSSKVTARYVIEELPMDALRMVRDEPVKRQP